MRTLVKTIALGAVTAAILASSVLTAPLAEAASEVTVHTVDDLQAAVSGATSDTVILLGSDFPQQLTSTVTLTQSANVTVTVDGGGISFVPNGTGVHMKVNASAGVLALENMTFTQSAASVTNKGLQVTQSGDAEVRLQYLDFTGLKSGSTYGGTPALELSGSGTGLFSIADSTFSGNEAMYASAIRVNRTSPQQHTVLKRVSMTDNLGVAGGGYSGGAMLIAAGSQGFVDVNDSLFLRNRMVDGGTYAHGGAIAQHNANVLLTVSDSYFGENAVASSSASNADGGAISVFNSGTGTRGSLQVTGSTFVGNTAQDDAAAIFIEGRSTNQTDTFTARATIRNSTFVKNVAGNVGGSDDGGAIQASLRSQVSVDHSTFYGNRTGGTVGGIDLGGHLGYDASYGFQNPKGEIVNSIVTRNASVNRSYFTCQTSVGCDQNASRVTVAQEPSLVNDVFGAETPELAIFNTALMVGDQRIGKPSLVLPVLPVVPPLSGTNWTAYRAASTPSPLVTDQLGNDFADTPTAGSVAMDFVRYDAATNGGSWSGLTSSFPFSGGLLVADATGGSGWYEIAAPNDAIDVPSQDPTPPANTVFIGWFTEASGGQQVTSAPAAGQTLYAQFADLTYTVTFDSAGGTPVAALPDIRSGDTIARPANPEREASTFVEWTLNGIAYDFQTPVTADITLVAQWKPVVPNSETPTPTPTSPTTSPTVPPTIPAGTAADASNNGSSATPDPETSSAAAAADANTGLPVTGATDPALLGMFAAAITGFGALVVLAAAVRRRRHS